MKKQVQFFLAALALLLLPLLLQGFGNAWVRIADMALLYVLLALGLNIVVGYAGLLDLGYVAFFAIGAYLYGLLSSPHLSETFVWLAAMFPQGLHTPLWLAVPLAAAVAGVLACCWARLRCACGATIWPSSLWALARSFACS